MTKLLIFMVSFTYLGLWKTIVFHTEATEFLKQGDRLNYSSSICSVNSTYCMAFQGTGDGNIYLAIYNATVESNSWIMWVANRNQPLDVMADSAALTLDQTGGLKITCQGMEPIVLYSGNKQATANNIVAELFDSGNFVLQQLNTDGTTAVLWQSFDHPTDVLFPGMKLGVDHKTGRNWSVVSYFLSSTPSSGAFSLEWEPGIGQLVIKRRGEVYWASGGLRNNNTFENIPLEAQHNIEYSIVSNEVEDSIMFTAKKGQYTAPWKLRNDGLLFEILGNNIAITGDCYGYNTDGGCQKRDVPTCRNAGEVFETMIIILNDAEKTSNYTSVNFTTNDCQDACWSNCDCVGFTDLYDNSTGCYFVNSGNSWQGFQNGSGTRFFMLNESSSSPPKTSPAVQGNLVKWIIPVIIIALISFFGFIFCLIRRRKKLMLKAYGYEDAKENQDTFHHGQDLRLFSYTCIMEATSGFSSTNKLGEGGFGPVYKGILMQQEVAIKRLSKGSRQGAREFKTELRLVSELQHMNLVKLLGCCIHGDERLLIYEYMPNKSLDFFLFDSTQSKLLVWKNRLNIIEGIAQGLLYLHKYSRVKIVHRDLKASNILLDEHMNPKISDFGMARIFMEESEENTARIVGTFGYMPPEYAMSGVFSRKTDVYSFGVLLLEIVSGRKNNSFSNFSSPMNLVGHAWDLWRVDQALHLVDPAIYDSIVEDEVLRCIHLGLLCVEEHPDDRPNIPQVLSLLSNSIETLPSMKKPAFYFGERVKPVKEFSKIDSINGISTTDFTAR